MEITTLHNSTSSEDIWGICLDKLKEKFSDKEHQFKAWIKPLSGEFSNNHLKIYAPNSFICNWVKSQYLPVIYETLIEVTGSSDALNIDIFESNSNSSSQVNSQTVVSSNQETASLEQNNSRMRVNGRPVTADNVRSNESLRSSNNINTPASNIITGSNLNPNFTFETF